MNIKKLQSNELNTNPSKFSKTNIPLVSVTQKKKVTTSKSPKLVMFC